MRCRPDVQAERVNLNSQEESVVLALVKRLCVEGYADFLGERTWQRSFLCIDGTIYDLTSDELAFIKRWLES